MKYTLKQLAATYPPIRKLLLKFFPSSSLLNRYSLHERFLRDLIDSHYDAESLTERRFYNIGAGSQRSKFPVWSYIDLKESGYDGQGIDVFYDLESLAPIPLAENSAEVVFNSFVIEHISAAATYNLCKEAFRILKPGGVFHSKIHNYEYGYLLWQNNIVSPMIPFGGRESYAMVEAFVRRHKGMVRSYFDRRRGYVLQSLRTPQEELCFSAADAFLLHNAVTAYEQGQKQGRSSEDLLRSLPSDDLPGFFRALQKNYIDQQTRRPHQHNADFIPQEELLAYIKDLGFSKVYFTQPYQSIAPVLWEEALNPLHMGFVYAIEAVK